MRVRMDMRDRNTTRCTQWGTTIVELMIATAIMTIVLGSILPVFAGIRNSSDAQQARSDMIQNARVLNEHLLRHLAQATRIVAVSPSAQADGSIDYEAPDGTIYRYSIGAEHYVEFGPVAAMAELAGPVDSLRFVCYDANDLGTETDVAANIRLVMWDGVLRSPGGLTQNRTVNGACCLRANGKRSWSYLTATYDYATRQQGVAAFAFADQGKPQIPQQPDVPSRVLDASEYDAIEADDGVFQTVNVASQADFAQARFTFRIEERRSDVVGITASWNGRGVSAHQARMDGAGLYIWNYRASGYELLAASPDTESEVTVIGTRNEGVASYIGDTGEDTVVLLVVSNDKETGQKGSQLFTDYVKVELSVRRESGALLP